MASQKKIRLGIVGVGKIVRDQHLPAIYQNDKFELLATASRNAQLDGVAGFKTVQEMLANVSLDAVALCMPPQYRYAAAEHALSNGLHVLLEKPPGSTISEVTSLQKLAQSADLSLFATWHSRHAAAVGKAKTLLANAVINSVQLRWKEDVRKWHPDQDWIWQAGGLGVFDPGINGLSILTEVMPEPLFVTSSALTFPANKAAPIAAEITLSSRSSTPIKVELDWRQVGNEVWEISFDTAEGNIRIADGGASLSVAGCSLELAQQNEYQSIYQRFADLIDSQQSDVDLTPLQLTADAFMLAIRQDDVAFA